MNKDLPPYPKNKMLKNIVLLLFVLFLYSKPAWSLANCDGDTGNGHEEIDEDITDQRHNCQPDDILIVQAGVLIKYVDSGLEDKTVLLRDWKGISDDRVTINNSGTIYGKNYTIHASGIHDLEINNYSGGDMASDNSSAIYLTDEGAGGVGDIRINNYGTIQSDTYGAIYNDEASAGDIYIHNEGTIKNNTQTLGGCSAASLCRSAIGITGGGGTTTIVNSGGTIKSTNDTKAAIKVNDNANAIITLDSGTLQSANSTTDIVILDVGDETGTTMNLGGSPTFTNGIDTNDTIVTIVLKNDISAAFSVYIYNSLTKGATGLTITDNLPANYTHSLTDPPEDLDSDGDADDRILSIITVPTLSSSSPADGATGVGVNDNIVLTFSEAVDAESGNIVIKKSSDDSIVETIGVTESKISGSGSTTITINPSSTLDQATGYYITIDATAFDSANSASYAGISDATTLNFNTGASDPLEDKDVVGLIEAQVDVAKQIIHHSSIPVLDRMEWLRRHKEENNLSHQGIKVSFTDPMLSLISDVLPVSTAFNPIEDVLPNDWAMWTEGSVTIGKTSGTDSASLKDIESTGFTIGVDRKVDQDLVHGFALRFGRDDVDVGSSGTSLDTHSFSLSFYRTDSYNDKTYLDRLLGFSALKTDHIRKSGANTLTGRRYGRQIFGSLSYSGLLEKDRFNLSPSGRLDVGYTNLSSYSETGKDALIYDTQNIMTGKISTGVLMDDTIQFSSITFRPNGRLEYGADFSPPSSAVLSYVSDPGTDYTLSVSKRALHNFRAGIGLDMETGGNLSVKTGYEKNKALDSSYSDTVRLGISYHHNDNTQYTLSFNGPDSSSATFGIQTTSSGFNVNFKLEYSATGEMPYQLASLSLVRSF